MAVTRRGQPQVRSPKPPKAPQDNGKRGLPAVDLKSVSTPTARSTSTQPKFQQKITSKTGTSVLRRPRPDVLKPPPQFTSQAAPTRRQPTGLGDFDDPLARSPRGEVSAPTTFSDFLTKSITDIDAANPFRGAARPNFDPDNFDSPTNVAEAGLAEQWLATTPTLDIADQEDFATGNIVPWNTLEQRAATPTEIRLFDFQNQLKADIQILKGEDANFRSKSRFEAIDTATTNFEDFVEQERRDALGTAAGDPDRIAEIDAEFDRRLDEFRDRAIDERETAVLQGQVDVGLVERRGQIEESLQSGRLQHQTRQNELDRALRLLEFDEATRSAQALEVLERDRFELEQQKFKLDIFSTLASSPEMLFFLGQQPGALESFGDLLGDGGSAISNLLENLQSKTNVNIQEFAQLSQTERGREQFRIQATTGSTDPIGLIAGQAPASFNTDPRGIGRVRIGRR